MWNNCLVALSGGCDSVALLLMLLERGARVEAAHCNFHLRGEESDRDEAFVKTLCEERGVPLHIAHFDTRTYAQLHHQSIELAARNLRYHYFEQLRRDLSLDYIAVAHHRDDQAETVLMHLLRGSGLHGLTGMHEENGRIVRPLLHYSRRQLEDYLRKKDQSYVTDSTNLERDATRNRIRLDVMPLLESIYPGAADHIASCAEHLQEAERVVEESLRAQLAVMSDWSDWSDSPDKSDWSDKSEKSELPRKSLLSYPAPSLLLHRLLSPCGFSPAQVSAIAAHLDAPTGTTYQSATHTLLFDRDTLIIAPTPTPLPVLRIPEPGTYILADQRRLRVEISERAATASPSREPLRATLDADTVRFPLAISTAQSGDRFQPYGMRGTQLVSDYLTNRRISLLDKQKQLVVKDATQTIVWLVGHRIGDAKKLTDETQSVLTLTLSE